MTAPVRFAFSLLLFTGLGYGADLTTPAVTILCYHEVEPVDAPTHTIPRRGASATPAEQRRYTVSREDFCRQLDYLRDHHYTVIPLADLHAYLSGVSNSLPDRSVVITVDDGWLCAYTEIFPELKKRALPWTLFIYPKTVSRGTHAVSWNQLREMARAGVDVQSHSLTHPFLTLKNHPELTEELYRTWLEQELLGSRTRIEKELGRRVRYFCYPYGDYDSTVATEAARHGYEAAVTTEPGVNVQGTDLMRLKRHLLHNSTTLEEFVSWLEPRDSATQPATSAHERR